MQGPLDTIQCAHYRLLAKYHRVMMLFWFWDDTKVEHHASKMENYISWDRIKQEKARV